VNSKYLHYAELADSHMKTVVESPQNWADMLTTSSRLYKYPFDEQLLIHAQKPDATACASYQLWNTSMKRFVAKGTKGIALLDEKNGKHTLKYVFDVSDTGAGRADAKTPQHWQMNDETEPLIREALTGFSEQKMSSQDGLNEIISQVAAEISRDYIEEHETDIILALNESAISGEKSPLQLYEKTLSDSIACTITKRCDPTADIEADTFFPDIALFNTPDALKSLGEAASTLSENVLREIESAIKNYEKGRDFNDKRQTNRARRNTLHSGRGLSDSRHSDSRRGSEPSGIEPVRQDAPELSQATSSDNLHEPQARGDAVSALLGSRGASEDTLRSDDEAIGAKIPAAGQGNTAHRMGGTHEQPERSSRGNNQSRTDLRIALEMPPEQGGIFNASQTSSLIETKLSEPQILQLSLDMFPSESEQRAEIGEEERREAAAKPVEITQQDIDNALMQWNGDEASKTRVFEHMQNGGSRTLNTAEFLRKEYGAGRVSMSNPSSSESFVILKNDDRQHIAAAAYLPWEDVQKRIGILIDEGHFMSPVELEITSSQFETKSGKELGYSLSYRFLDDPDRIIVFNDTDPDEINIVARVHGGGEIFIIDENAPQSVIDELTEYATENFDSLKEDAERRSDAFFKHAEEIGTRAYSAPGPQKQESPKQELDSHGQATKPEESPASPQFTGTPGGGMLHIPAENFRITDPHLGEGGAKTKYICNIEAIRALKTIESENRRATPDEQEILSRYVGWGGIQQAFDENAQGWQKEFAELRELLTPDEYDAARASTLNAHYTSPVVIEAMYETLERLGVRGGNILEPSCGVGNFFGLLPDSMQGAKLHGVELDSITGRIAQQLYPNADIKVTGFEKTDMPDNFFDVAIGNVPFGGFGVNDKKYDKHNFMIHDYFFAKSLDQVRPGGIVAFVTSKGTMDKANPKVRKYLAERADLLGAVRLPNNAFLKNAGTEVTSDIIFLQKRDTLRAVEPDWVHLGETENGITVNSYFADNPHMILGTMSVAGGTRMYGREDASTCLPHEGANLAEQLREALSHIQGRITDVSLDDIADTAVDRAFIPADASVKNFSYALVTLSDDPDNVTGQYHALKIGAGDLYFCENSRMYRMDSLPAATTERIRGMVELRDCTRTLIDMQLADYPDTAITAQQAQLNTLYDNFTRKHGLINSSANARAFEEDSSYYLLASLEKIDENGALERKSDMFTKRTIKQFVQIDSVDTSAEALAVSISRKARVNMPFMRELTGFSEEKIVADLQGVIFELPNARDITGEKIYVPANEYLSGNVREKLAVAREVAVENTAFAVNVAALEQAQPAELEASEIGVRLGSTWVDREHYQQFMYELLQTPVYQQSAIKLHYSDITGEWSISGKTVPRSDDVLVRTTFGTERTNAYKIFEDSLNLRDTRIYDAAEVNGKEVRELNKKATMLAQQKQESIKEAFKSWIFADADRRKTLVEKYNVLFNSTRTREFDGSHIEFAGASPEISLRPHQRGAIARILYGGNTLLAHEVGAGKTFEMIGAAMESKRLGLCNKSMFVVPNHIIEDIAGEFMRLYPAANILVASKKDFEPKNRKKFCARIATGEYDAVIIGHSQFEKIPLSKERQQNLLEAQINDITDGIEQVKRDKGERFTIKQMEKTKKSLQTRLKKLTDDTRKDDVVTFEQLGVDRLFVDEAHNYKNLFLVTKMRNVAGLSTSEAQKSSDLFMKCRYLDELTGNKGVIFATGTPISNSMSELYTMMRYLQYDTLNERSLQHFDSWASTFGETVTAIELAPEGTGYRAKTRFAKFTNLPELMTLFKEVADIKTADTLDLPRPKANFHTIVAEPSDIQRELVKGLSERATRIQQKKVDATEDNMLKITSDGRKIGLDARMINSSLPDEPGSKVNLCTENIFRILDETAENRSTQLVFCDFSTPNKDGRFNVYDDIRDKLLAKGIPKSEIAFIHDYNTEVQKKELFQKVRTGKVRILFGSTAKCGAGTNVQDKLIALHDLDCPWRPADLEQRSGRIVRQGNQNSEVDIFRYVTDGTFDSYLFQTIENKQKFIAQVMTSKSPVRTCDDMDESALNYAEIKALCAGNPLIAEKMNLDVEVAKLKMLKADHQSQQYRLEDSILTRFPDNIQLQKNMITGYEADIRTLAENTHKPVEGISPMNIGGKIFTDRKDAGEALIDASRKMNVLVSQKIGEYRGFNIFAKFEHNEYRISLKMATSHQITLGNSPEGNIQRIDNALEKLPEKLQQAEQKLESLYFQVEAAKAELGKPFAQEELLAEKSARLVELDSLLSLDAADAVAETSQGEKSAPVVSTSSQIETKLTDDTKKKPALAPLMPKVFAGATEKNPSPEAGGEKNKTARERAVNKKGDAL